MANQYAWQDSLDSPFGSYQIGDDDWGTSYWQDPDVTATFEGQPRALWQTMALEQLGRRALLPQFQGSVMRGYEPAYGQYLMSDPTQFTPGQGTLGTFGSYLTGTRLPQTTGVQGHPATALYNWERAVEASRRAGLDHTPVTGTYDQGDAAVESMRELEAFFQDAGDEGGATRGDMLAMALAAGGGYGGIKGRMQRNALENLYDLYAARGRGAGVSPGTFLGYLSDQGWAPRNTGRGLPAHTGWDRTHWQ